MKLRPQLLAYLLSAATALGGLTAGRDAVADARGPLSMRSTPLRKAATAEKRAAGDRRHDRPLITKFANSEGTVKIQRSMLGRRAAVMLRGSDEPATSLWHAFMAIEASHMAGALGVDVTVDAAFYPRYGKQFVDTTLRWLRARNVSTSSGRRVERNVGVPEERVKFRRKASKSKTLMWGGQIHPELLGSLATKLDIVGDVIDGASMNAEGLTLPENPRGKDIYYVMGKSVTASETFHAEMLDMLRVVKAAKQSGARSVTIITPYLPYSRSDRMDSAGIAVGAALLPKLMSKAGVDRAMFFSIHQAQELGIFQAAEVMPIHLSGEAILAATLGARIKAANLPVDKVVVVAPDAGAEKRAKVFARFLAAELGVPADGLVKRVKVASKERRGLDTTTRFSDSVKGEIAVVVDDETASGGTLMDLAKAARGSGATHVFAAVSHLTGNARDKIRPGGDIDKLFVLDTLPQKETRESGNQAIEVVGIAETLGTVIGKLQQNNSIEAHLFLEQ
ncbi:MAG: ribose-phosphate pyrophosphokinase [Myxococcales bacterium]|nr:ribose-phosphate pyrophosphokinase [Myxococcales bacterium]